MGKGSGIESGRLLAEIRKIVIDDPSRSIKDVMTKSNSEHHGHELEPAPEQYRLETTP